MNDVGVFHATFPLTVVAGGHVKAVGDAEIKGNEIKVTLRDDYFVRLLQKFIEEGVIRGFSLTPEVAEARPRA